VITELFGKFDENIKIVEEEFPVEIVLRDGRLAIIGDDASVQLAEKLIYKLIEIINKQKRLTKQAIRYAIQLVLNGEEERLKELLDDIVCITASGKIIKPKTLGQKRYIEQHKEQ